MEAMIFKVPPEDAPYRPIRRELGLDSGKVVRLELEHHHASGGILGKSLGDSKPDLLSGFHATLDQMGADQLLADIFAHASISFGFPGDSGRGVHDGSAAGPARLQLTHGLKRQVCMRVSAACAHLGGDPNRFHHLLLCRTVVHRKLGVAANAVWTLGDVDHRDRDQLLGLDGQRALGEYPLAECLERGGDLRRELGPFACEFFAEWGIKVHVVSSFNQIADG
jgi:hypothetical protein